MFRFPSSKSQSPYLVLENVGNTLVHGSMPDSTTIMVTKRARAATAKRAAALMDAISFNPTMVKGKIHFAPVYPKTTGKEVAKTDVKVLVPLNMEFPLNLAVAGGDIGIRGTKGAVNLVVKGTSKISFNTFKGKVKARIERGELTLSNHLEGGEITMKEGKILVSQREKEPLEDIVITLEKGTVSLELIKGLKVTYDISAPKIVNNSTIKLNGGKGGKGKNSRLS